MSNTLLVTGASGQLGQRVLTHLIDSQGVDPARIIAGSRNPDALADWTAKGVAARKVDFDDPALAGALAGVDRMLIISTDAIDRPGLRIRQHTAAVTAAKQAGIKHLLYTSMPNPDDTLIPFAPDHLGTEEAIKASGIPYTILRNSWYMENLFMALPQVLESGQWFTAAGDGRVGQIAREDCARAAAAALAADSGDGRTYTLTGPMALTVADLAVAASAAFGKDIAVIPVTDEQLTQGMIAAGIPDILAPIFAAFDANTREGKVDVVTGDVEALTGTAPTTIESFFAANKAALAM